MIRIDSGEVTLEALEAVAHGAAVQLSDDPGWRARVERSRQLHDEALAAGRPIYGVTTGVGSSSSTRIEPEDREAFYVSMLEHHGCGLGEPFDEATTRAIVFARLASLAKGCSAVRLELLEALAALLEAGVVPVVPRLGSVGASGDLTPLSYVAAVLFGKREASYRGEVLSAAEALSRAGLRPLRPAAKEPIALVNGTSVMTAVGALAVLRLERTLAMAERTTALQGEVLSAATGAFHPVAHAVKPHPGQVASAAAIREALAGSAAVDGPREGRMVQDPYSVRCAPQVLGAARDAAAWARSALTIELNSVNDNPLVDPDSGEILFAGNFYGGHVALAMDLVKISVATVANLVDRQVALLLDTRFNLGLPETLVGYGGNGIKALQLTTSALTALVVQGSAPDAVTSRPTEVGNQDVVSMGTHAALGASTSVSRLQAVLATQLVALSNAAHLRDEARFGPPGRALLAAIRERSPVLVADRRLDRDLERLMRLVDCAP